MKEENSVNLTIYPHWKYSSKIKVKIIAEWLCFQQICTMKSPSQRKIIPNLSLDLQKGRKKPGMGKHLGAI